MACLALSHSSSDPTVLTYFHLSVLIPNRMAASRCSHPTRASAIPARLKGPPLDNRLSFVLSFSMINAKFMSFEIMDIICFLCSLRLYSTLRGLFKVIATSLVKLATKKCVREGKVLPERHTYDQEYSII